MALSLNENCRFTPGSHNELLDLLVVDVMFSGKVRIITDLYDILIALLRIAIVQYTPGRFCALPVLKRFSGVQHPLSHCSWNAICHTDLAQFLRTHREREARMRIGILEDYQALGSMLELTLKVAGYSVQTAHTIEDFFAHVMFPDPPDLLIVDFLLQEKYSGAEVIREVRKKTPLRPVILISAAPLATLRTAISGIPQVIILQKPFQMSALREIIQKLLSQS